ncbi:hypothetical protein GCM10010205_68890 [Streptomyces nojiriensis]|nr:hypothetical protein GCM10010205_68890 [Streptomyces nojiriensis]
MEALGESGPPGIEAVERRPLRDRVGGRSCPSLDVLLVSAGTREHWDAALPASDDRKGDCPVGLADRICFLRRPVGRSAAGQPDRVEAGA